MTLKKRKLILVLCALGFFSSAPLVILYTDGYRWNPNLGLYKTGGLYISSSVNGSKIFINGKEKKETNIFQDGIFLKSLKPGQYVVLVNKDNYWPWSKKLRVQAQMVTEARAVLIPQEPKGEIIMRVNRTPLEISKYDEILMLIKETKTATTTLVSMSSNQKEKLQWNPKENKVWLEWLGDKNSLPYFFCEDNFCEEKIIIYKGDSLVKNVAFYPKRKDVALIASQNTIYALEIDGRDGKRAIYQIYKGKDPYFMTYKNESSVYVLDENNLIKIDL